MPSYLLSLMALIFGAVSLFIIGLFYTSGGSNREISSRLNKFNEQAALQEQVNLETGTRSHRMLASVSRTAVRFGLFNRLARSVDRNLTGADKPLRSEEFIILVACISGLAWVLATLAFLNVFYGIAAAVLAVLFSMLWVESAKARRLGKFNSQIGDSLVIMSNSLRSGFSFLQAMDMVRKELPNPIAMEFGRTFQEMNLGTPTEEALENLNARVGSDDLELVITAVLIQRQVGGNLAEILDNIANTIRERIRIKGEIKTLTAQGKISGLVIGILPFALAGVLSVMSPEYLSPLFTDPIGLLMLGSAVALEIAGIIMIKRIINIKV